MLYLGETDLSVDLSAMRKEADAIREDEVTPALWLQLLGLKESALDGIETAVRYQRVLGEIHLLQVHYEDYKDAYERYKKFVETEGVDDASLKEALELFAAAGSADEVSGLMRIWIRLGRSIYPMWQSRGCQFGFAGRRVSVTFGKRRDV